MEGGGGVGGVRSLIVLGSKLYEVWKLVPLVLEEKLSESLLCV